jgi:membrane protein DedA with SNARE-associated domain
MHSLIALWFGWVRDWGYWGVIILMAMESSITPVPSEIVIPPAAFFVAEGRMSFWGVVLAGTLGSYIGAALTYWVARSAGRGFLLKYGRFFLLNEKKLDAAEVWMHRYEAGGIFFARLLPGIRHVISIPAGVVRMNFAMFSAMTVLGSFIWCWVLAYLGVRAYEMEPNLINDPAGLVHFIKGQSHWILLSVLALAGLYFLVLKLTAKPIKEVAIS